MAQLVAVLEDTGRVEVNLRRAGPRGESARKGATMRGPALVVLEIPAMERALCDCADSRRSPRPARHGRHPRGHGPRRCRPQGHPRRHRREPDPRLRVELQRFHPWRGWHRAAHLDAVLEVGRPRHRENFPTDRGDLDPCQGRGPDDLLGAVQERENPAISRSSPRSRTGSTTCTSGNGPGTRRHTAARSSCDMRTRSTAGSSPGA